MQPETNKMTRSSRKPGYRSQDFSNRFVIKNGLRYILSGFDQIEWNDDLLNALQSILSRKNWSLFIQEINNVLFAYSKTAESNNNNSIPDENLDSVSLDIKQMKQDLKKAYKKISQGKVLDDRYLSHTINLKQKIQRRILAVGKHNEVSLPLDAQSSQTVDSLDSIYRDSPNLRRQLRDLTRRFLRQYLEKLEQNSTELFEEKRLKKLREYFQLSDEETEIIRCLFVLEDFPHWDHFYKSKFDLSTSSGGYLHLSYLTGIPPRKIRKYLSSKEKLVTNSMIYKNNRTSLDSAFAEMLTTNVEPGRDYFKKATGKTFPLDSFRLSTRELQNLTLLLQTPGPGNILLYGEPGTGKTEFIKSLGRELKLPVYFCNHSDDGKLNIKRLNIILSEKMNCGHPCLLVIDEADFLLNTTAFGFFAESDSEKGWLNDFLDGHKSKVIWVSNRIKDMDPSVLRRFHYQIRFDPFTSSDRERMWTRALTKHPLRKYLDRSFIRELSLKYNVNAAGVTRMLDKAAQMAATMEKNSDVQAQQIREIIHDIVKRHHSLIHRIDYKKPEKSMRIDTSRYDTSILNTSQPLKAVRESISSFLRYREQKKNSGQTLQGLNLLFYGLPGTGKSEFARNLAENLGLKIIYKRGSDLLHPYVGVSEMLIRDAFREADEENTILLLDEADTFLKDRRNNRASWESSQTNEFLTQMESSTGIFICTTNLLDGLDPAALRRFQWKVGFEPLRRGDKFLLLKKYFTEMLPGLTFTSRELNELESLHPLTPGDYQAVYSRLQYFTNGITPKTILSEMAAEVSLKKDFNQKIIGF